MFKEFSSSVKDNATKGIKLASKVGLTYVALTATENALGFNSVDTTANFLASLVATPFIESICKRTLTLVRSRKEFVPVLTTIMTYTTLSHHNPNRDILSDISYIGASISLGLAIGLALDNFIKKPNINKE